MPEVTTVALARSSSLRGHVLQQRGRSGSPGAAVCERCPAAPLASATRAPRRAIVWSVISVTCAASPVTFVTLPTSPPLPVGGDHRLSCADAGARALVDRDRRVPERRRAADHARGDRLRRRRAPLLPSSSSRLRSCAFSCVAPRSAPTTLAAQLVALACVRSLTLALGVERVADPAEEVADGLERAAGALLDRRDDLEDAALDGVQAAAGRLAEVGGQEDQGADDEQREHCPPPANRLVVHVTAVSKACGPGALVAAPAGCCGILVGAVDRPRTPRASGPSRPRRRSAATRPGARASGSPRAGARRAPAAASRRRPA